MRFHVRVGILPHERELPQPLSIDASVLAASDQLLDYRELYELVSTAVSGEPLEYIETVAEDIAGAALQLEGVHQAHVIVRKPHVMLPGPLAGAEVEVVRTRTGQEQGSAVPDSGSGARNGEDVR